MTTLIANRYQIRQKIGAGGMGIVYQVMDRLTRQNVALKRVTTPDNQLMFASRASNDNFHLAIAQEFKVLASLRHPNIIRVLDYGFDADQAPFFTMSYLEQVKTIIDAGHPLPLSAKMRLIMQALNALLYLHRHNVLHRDLKPANILVDNDLTLTVLDFGLSITTKEARELVGTLRYIAPETLQHSITTQASDLYSLGVVAYELITGQSPYEMTHPNQLIADIIHKNVDVELIEDVDLQRLMTRWLHKIPAKRPQDAQELIAALKPYVGDEPLIETVKIQESFLQSAQFVGRNSEFSQLKQALERAASGKGSGWLIGGESGVGKSRLLDELRTLGLVQGATVIRTSGIQESGLSFQLWRDVIRRLVLNVTISDIEAGILVEVVPDIGSLLENQDIIPAPEINAVLAQDRLIQTITDLVKRQPQLTVLLLEDLHWVDESLKVIDRLWAFVDNLPLMIVGNYRNDERPDLAERLMGMNQITLNRFDATAIQDLSVSMLGKDGAMPEIIDFLQTQTEGNAFFIVEAMRALAENAGDLSQIGAKTLPEYVITGGMQDVVQRRINRIPEQLHPLLKVCAVIGRNVLPELLQQIESPVTIEEWVTLCINGAILEHRDGNLRFAHDKLREIILNDLAAAEIRTYNQQAAELIESYYPDYLQYAATLSNHWQHADNEPKTTYYASITCEKMSAIANYNDTHKYGTRALAGESLSPVRRADIMRMVGAALHQMGRPDDAIVMYQTALERAEDVEAHDIMAEALIGLANIAATRADFDTHETYVRQAIVLAQSKKTQGYANLFLAAVYRLKEDLPQAQIYIERALSLFREINDVFAIMGILNDQSVQENQLGQIEAALGHINECLELAYQIGNQRSISIVLCNIVYIGFSVGEYRNGITTGMEALRVAENVNDQQNILMSLNRLALAYAHLGNFEEAKAHYERALPIAERLNRSDTLIPAMATLTLIAIAENDLETAGAFLKKMEPLQENNRAWLQSIYRLTAGSYYKFRADYAQAKKHYEAGLAVIKDIDEPWRTSQMMIKLAHVLTDADEIDAARATVLNALDTLRKLKMYPYILDGLLALAHIYHLDGKNEIAAQWIGLVANHPALSIVETECWIGTIADDIAHTLGHEAFEEEMDAGESLDLMTVVNSLFA